MWSSRVICEKELVKLSLFVGICPIKGPGKQPRGLGFVGLLLCVTPSCASGVPAGATGPVRGCRCASDGGPSAAEQPDGRVLCEPPAVWHAVAVPPQAAVARFVRTSAALVPPRPRRRSGLGLWGHLHVPPCSRGVRPGVAGHGSRWSAMAAGTCDSGPRGPCLLHPRSPCDMEIAGRPLDTAGEQLGPSGWFHSGTGFIWTETVTPTLALKRPRFRLTPSSYLTTRQRAGGAVHTEGKSKQSNDGSTAGPRPQEETEKTRTAPTWKSASKT